MSDNKTNNVVTPKKGFRQASKLTKGKVLQENTKLKQGHEPRIAQVEGSIKFMGQQFFQLYQTVQRLNKEHQAMANLLRFKTVAGVAKDGDSVMIDFAGRLLKEDGTPGDTFPGSFMLGSVVKIGSKGFVPGFEEGLIDMKPGETKEIEVEFPENYVKALKGKKAVFLVRLIANWRPATNDGFIEGEFNKWQEVEKKAKEEAAKAKLVAIKAKPFDKLDDEEKGLLEAHLAAEKATKELQKKTLEEAAAKVKADKAVEELKSLPPEDKAASEAAENEGMATLKEKPTKSPA